MLTPAFPLSTRRLLLQPYTPTDLDFLGRLESDPEVLRFLDWGPRAAGHLRDSLAEKVTQTALRAEGDDLTLLVRVAATGERVGDVQLSWTSAEHRQGEIGFITHPAHAGQGYATEAAELMLRLGFTQLGLHRIHARLDARNTGSARVCERLGLRREAHLRQNAFRKGEWTDEVVYAALATEWQDPPLAGIA